jgi:hypothetical protein
VGRARSDTANTSTDLKFSLNGVGNYSSHVFGADGVTQFGPSQILNDTYGEAGIIPVAADQASVWGIFELYLIDTLNSNAYKGWLFNGGFFGTGGGRLRYGDGNYMATTGPLTGFNILPAAGNFIAGTTIMAYGEP